MIPTPIRDPLPGERLLAVVPTPAPQVDPEAATSAETRGFWRRRLRPYAGRTLTADALNTEQRHRGGLLAARGQLVSAGVITGLDVVLQSETTEDGVEWFYNIGAGTGVTAYGEDVSILKPIRIPIGVATVHAPRVVPPEAIPADEEPGTGPTPGPPADAQLAREDAGPFADWIEENADAPRAGMLVLRPVEYRADRDFDPDAPLARQLGRDPCEEDPSSDAFDRLERRDGAQLVFYPWPLDWLPLPVSDDQWRNRLAFTLFREELKREADVLLPWESVGVPIALIGFDEAWTPLFADRGAVVRAGGKPRPRTDLMERVGNPFLWQARLEQFAEHLAELTIAGVTVEAAAEQFRYLPPAGLLPRNAVDFETGADRFFPSTWYVDAVPIPTEQLDLALEQSAALGPFDRFVPDQVRVLVPVPQRWYEPRLLLNEDVDRLFYETLERFLEARTEWLLKRDDLRAKADTLHEALTGRRAVFPPPPVEPGRLDPDEGVRSLRPLSGNRCRVSPVTDGLHFHAFAGASDLTAAPGERLFAWVFLDPLNPPRALALVWTTSAGIKQAVWGDTGAEIPAPTGNGAVRVDAGGLPPQGRWVRLEIARDLLGIAATVTPVNVTGLGFFLLDGAAAWDRSGVADPAQPNPETVWLDDDLPTDAQELPGGERWTWLDRNPAPAELETAFDTTIEQDQLVSARLEALVDQLDLKPLATRELYEVRRSGVSHAITQLEQRIDSAEDVVNFGFLRVNTEQYRIRQLVLGDEAAGRLVVLPAAAALVKDVKSAAALQKSLAEVYDKLKASNVASRAQPGAPPPSAAPSSATSTFVSTLSNAATVSDDVKVSFTDAFTRAKPVASKVSARVNLRAVRAPLSAAARAGSDALLSARPATPLSKAGTIADELIGAARPRVPEEPEPPSFSSILKRTGASKAGLFASAKNLDSVIDVIGQAPISGKARVNTSSIGERLEDPKSVEAKDFATAAKHDVIKSVLGLDLNLDGIVVPGMPAYVAPAAPGQLYTAAPAGTGATQSHFTNGLPRRGNPVELDEFRADTHPELLTLILNEVDPVTPATNEAAYFSIATDLLNQTIAVLRQIEGRISDYRNALAVCRAAANDLQESISGIDRRLKVVEDELTEARHDVATARALLADEQQRTGAINERRHAILREHVPFLAFHRPRFSDALTDVPVRTIDPGPTPSAVPACLAREIESPAELRAFVDLFREAPAAWCRTMVPLVDRLDRLEALRDALSRAKDRLVAPAPLPTLRQGIGLLGNAVSHVMQAQVAVLQKSRDTRLARPLSNAVLSSWSTAKNEAKEILTLGDLIAGEHGYSDVARRAALELDQLAHVASCLYSAFSQVRPALRLVWAEGLSQYDGPADLRALARLPRWGEIDVLDRREMQSLADWLFERMDLHVADAANLMNDLVRTALLLASHSPVNELIAGHVHSDTPLRVGGRIPLIADLTKVRVGMQVLMYRGVEVVARGVVEDLGNGLADARILHSATNDTIAAGARVQFGSIPAATLLLGAGTPRR